LGSYNQGYGRRIKHDKIQIGAATFQDDKGNAEAQAAGFYAIAYDVADASGVEGLADGTTVTSYRGAGVAA